MEHGSGWTLWFGNIHYTDDGHVIRGEYRLNTYRAKQWIRLSLENPVYYMTRLDQIVSGEPSLLYDQTCEWGHADTALSQTVSICPSYGSFCGHSHTES